MKLGVDPLTHQLVEIYIVVLLFFVCVLTMKTKRELAYTE